jgi:hypothetical protein
MHGELMAEAAKKGRAAFMQAQALAVAAERSFVTIVRVRDGAATAAELNAAATRLAATHRRSERAVRDARESVDRLLDALGADAAPRVLERSRASMKTPRAAVGTVLERGDR